MFRRFLLIGPLALILLLGCQTQKTVSPAFYQSSSEPVFPAINFYSMKPSAALTEQCNARKCYPDVQFLDGVYTQLQASKIFQEVDTGPNAGHDYSIYAVVRQFVNESVATDIAKGALAGATLLLVPTSESREYRSEFIVAWHGLKIAEYSFTTPFEYKLSLYDTPAKQNSLICEKIVAEFIASAQADNVFTSERIYSALQAEDYHRDLKPPLQIGSYRHRDFHLFPDPRAGVQLRYENQKSAKEIADVFVYPIRQSDWSDTTKTTADEINIALKDIDLAVKGGVYKSAQFDAPKVISFSLGGKPNKGWVSAGKINWADGKITNDFIYVFTVKDKYLKFRFSLIDPISDSAQLNEFVSGFVNGVVVPDESFFMASLRQRWRSSTVK